MVQLCIDVPRYLPYLMNRFLASGGRAFRTTLPSLSALLSNIDRPAFEVFPPNSSRSPPTLHPTAVIICTGLGALSIGDVLGISTLSSIDNRAESVRRHARIPHSRRGPDHTCTVGSTRLRLPMDRRARLVHDSQAKRRCDPRRDVPAR
jgi:hypothetical protein